MDASSIDWAAVEQQDRRRAATHEAGHATVATALGLGDVYCSIWKNRDLKDPWEERHWDGECGYRYASSLPPVDQAAIGLAGVIAECIWFDGDGSNAEDIADWIAAEVVEPSETDWQRVPPLWRSGGPELVKAIERAAELLHANAGLHAEILGELLNGEPDDRGLYGWDLRFREEARES